MLKSVITYEVLASHLEISVVILLIYIKKITFDDNNRGIEYDQIYYRADRYEVQLNKE